MKIRLHWTTLFTILLTWTPLVTAPVGLVGCLTNSDISSLGVPKNTDDDIDAANPSDGASETGILKLSQVVLNRTNPQTQVDLVGSGNQIGLFCTGSDPSGTSDSTGDASKYPCTCRFDFTRSDGSHENFDVNPLYQESNLIRCDYSSLPSGLEFTKVKIHLMKVDQYSNELTLRFSGSSVILNPQDIASFGSVSRYQCRDSTWIPYLYDAENIYDPIQSEDPTLSVSLNFYTTNMGLAMQHFIYNPLTKPDDKNAGWICPPQPNDPAYGTNLTLYSKKSDGGSSTIFPTAGSRTDRSNFYLARSKTGVFTLPVNAYIAPRTPSSEANAGQGFKVGSPAPLGYGAHPIAGSNETETCPGSDVAIPAGFKWAKLWLFRASMEPRKYKDSDGLRGAGWLGCNPGNWNMWDKDHHDLAGPIPQIFRDCGGDTDGDGDYDDATDIASYPFYETEPAGGWTPNSSGTVLADRIIGNTRHCLRGNHLDFRAETIAENICGDKSVPNGAGCTTYGDLATPATLRGTQKTGYEAFAKGTDIWARSGADEKLRCADDAQYIDYLNICSDAAPEGYSVLHDRTLVENKLEENSRYDFVFVVSPTNIMSKHFKNNATEALPYTPYRFLSPNDCKSADPENPDTDGDCPLHRKQSYEFKAHDIGTNGDSSSDSNGRLPVFPVCVLQAVAS